MRPARRSTRARGAQLTRLILPFALPIGAILVVAFYTFNLSRVFIATSEGDSTAAVILAAGITLAILGGATAIAAFPEIRTSSLVIGLSLVMLVVLMAGSIVLGTSEPESEASATFVEPKGPAINTLEVDALPELSFQAKSFDVPGGVNQIKYIDKGGTHTLVFADNKVPGFQLAVPNGKSASKVGAHAEQHVHDLLHAPRAPGRGHGGRDRRRGEGRRARAGHADARLDHRGGHDADHARAGVGPQQRPGVPVELRL